MQNKTQTKTRINIYKPVKLSEPFHCRIIGRSSAGGRKEIVSELTGLNVVKPSPWLHHHCPAADWNKDNIKSDYN